MRSHRFILSILLFLLLLPSVPSPSFALTVTISSGGGAPITPLPIAGPTTVTDPVTGIRTTTLELPPTTVNGFMVTCSVQDTVGNCTTSAGGWKVVATQSASIIRLALKNLRITAPGTLPSIPGTGTVTTGVGATTTPPAPSTTITFSQSQNLAVGTSIQTQPAGNVYVIRSGSGATYTITQAVDATAAETGVTWTILQPVQITASTGTGDFTPLTPNAQGYPLGVIYSGNFTGDPIFGPPGDQISVTGFVSVLGGGANDAINRIAGGSGDQGVSLPSSSQGDPLGSFMATASAVSFGLDEMPETMQLCFPGETPPNCVTSFTPVIQSTTTVVFANGLDRVDLPNSVDVNMSPTGDPAPVNAASPGFAAFSAAVNVPPLMDQFALGSIFTLNPASSAARPNQLDPVKNLVQVRVGGFSTAISPGSFTRQTIGGVTFFTLQGVVINNVTYNAVLIPLGGNQYSFDITSGQGANMIGTPNPAPVELSIGSDNGSTLAQVFMFGERN